jgi:hypothetical protein
MLEKEEYAAISKIKEYKCLYLLVITGILLSGVYLIHLINSKTPISTSGSVIINPEEFNKIEINLTEEEKKAVNDINQAVFYFDTAYGNLSKADEEAEMMTNYVFLQEYYSLSKQSLNNARKLLNKRKNILLYMKDNLDEESAKEKLESRIKEIENIVLLIGKMYLIVEYTENEEYEKMSGGQLRLQLYRQSKNVVVSEIKEICQNTAIKLEVCKI